MAAVPQWSIDGKTSKVQFYTKNGASMSVAGSFRDVTGEIRYAPSQPDASRVVARIPLTTLETSIAKRNSDLMGADYFNVERFATASFVSTRFRRDVGGKYLLSGKFTLHGVTKNVDIKMELPKIDTAKNRLAAMGSAIIDHKDYNLTLKKLHPDGFVWINSAITIVLTIDAVKKQ
jgi:polyisoprenoid-binding protein YceI